MTLDVTQMAHPIGDTFPRELTPEPQDYLGLAAADFLLLAEGHLTQAKRVLDLYHAIGRTESEETALLQTTMAIESVQEARYLLSEKEEPCKPQRS